MVVTVHINNNTLITAANLSHVQPLPSAKQQASKLLISLLKSMGMNVSYSEFWVNYHLKLHGVANYYQCLFITW